jgi:hypothetical protein
MLAVAVGYLLVSAVPQQVSMYTNPPNMLVTSEKVAGSDEVTQLGEGETIPENDGAPDDTFAYETTRSIEEPSFWEMSRLPELVKWWTLDVVIAISIYWVARRSLS